MPPESPPLLDGPPSLDQLLADLHASAKHAGLSPSTVPELVALLDPPADARNSISVLALAARVLRESEYEYAESVRDHIRALMLLAEAYGDYMAEQQRNRMQPQHFGVGMARGILRSHPVWSTMLLVADRRQDASPEAWLLSGAVLAAQARAASLHDEPYPGFLYALSLQVRHVAATSLHSGALSLAELSKWVRKETEPDVPGLNYRNINRLIAYATGHPVQPRAKQSKTLGGRRRASTLSQVALLQELGLPSYNYISRSDLRGLVPSSRGAPDEISGAQATAYSQTPWQSSGVYSIADMKRRRTAGARRVARANRVDALCRSV